MANRQADSAPGDGGNESVRDEEEARPRSDPDPAADLPRPVIKPPPAPGMEEEIVKSTSSWTAALPNPWIIVKAQDTRAMMLEQIGRSLLERFNADTGLSAGKAVTMAWLDNQLAPYSFPITADDAKAAARSVFETNGVAVQEG